MQVDPDAFYTETMKSWKHNDIEELLNVAEAALKESCSRMRLDVQFLRKARAVGCYPTRAEVIDIDSTFCLRLLVSQFALSICFPCFFHLTLFVPSPSFALPCSVLLALKAVNSCRTG